MALDIHEETTLDPELVERIKKHDFEVLKYLDEEIKESDTLKQLIREAVGVPDKKIFVYEATYQERRRFDHTSYDYKYMTFRYYLNEQNAWESECVKTSYSERFKD